MGVTLSGVYSGIDSNSIIAQLMAIESRPLYRLEARKQLNQYRESAVTEIETILGQLDGLVDTIRDSADLRSVAASSTDTDILTASAEGSAGEGNHTIIVNQLAVGERMVHTAGEAGLEDPISASDAAFVYTYDGTTRTVQVTDETTLEDLVNLINNDSSNPGVTASILEYDSAYHLVLAGDDTGDDYDITVDDVQTTLVGYDTADFTESQDAADAQIRVDGFPAADWITRSSNTITDVLPGVTLTLKSTSAQAVNVSLTRSTGQLQVHLENLVAIFNALVDTVAEFTNYDTETKARGLLQGDAGLNDIVSRLRLVLTQAVPGFQEEQDAYTLPANIGIGGVNAIEEQDGHVSLDLSVLAHLSLDPDVFADALAEDYEAVLSLIGAQGEGSSDDAGDYIQFISATDSTTAGIYEVQVFFNDQGDILSAGIRPKGEAGWNSDVNIDGNAISGRVGYPEQGLEITAIWDGVTLGDPQTAEISVRHGFADGLHDILDDVLDAVTGVIDARKDRFADQIEAIDRNIEFQQSRLETKQKLLIARYARLEATLARIDAQQAAVYGLLQSMGSIAT